jgi:predicted ATPase
MWGWTCRRTPSRSRCWRPDRDVADVDKIFNDEESVRRLFKRLGRPSGLWACDEGVDLARRQGHPFILTHALSVAAWVRQLVGDDAGVIRLADEAVELGHRHGFRQYVPMAGVLRGWAMGDAAQMEGALRDLRASGSRMLRHVFLGLLAEVHLSAGRRAEAMVTLDEALADVEEVNERVWEAELHRLKGELLARDGKLADAGQCLRRALAVAHAQQAQQLEARAVESLRRFEDAQA